MNNNEISRFLESHQRDYPAALAEIRNGRKVGHWIWYIFPQMRGLGRSNMSDYYGIRSLQEAREYLAHPVLGADLIEISEALLVLNTDDPTEVMGNDYRKLKSSMTLFAEAADDNDVFENVLKKYFDGRKDRRTLNTLGL